MKTKIIISLAIMALAGAAAIGGTMAYFSDAETSKGNTFTAGALDLKIDSECHYDGMICKKNDAGALVWQNEIAAPPSSTYPELLGEPCTCTWGLKNLEENDLFFNFLDVKPGDVGENTISLHVDNNPSWVCAKIANLTGKENGCANNAELGDDPDCATDLTGELGQALKVTIWRDTDCDNKLDVEGACVANENPGDDNDPAECAAQTNNGQQACNSWIDTPEETTPECHWVPGTSEQILVDNTPIDSNNGVWPLYDSQTGDKNPLAGGATNCIGIKWSVDPAVNNEIQGDSLTGDVTFSAVQSRNNLNFVCGTPAPTTGTVTVTKVVNNTGGGTAQVSDFGLLVGATSVTSGVSGQFAPGPYTISETGPTSSYNAVYSGDCDASTHALTAVAGQTKACTITNTFVPQPANLIVTKVVNNSPWNGNNIVSDFTLTVDGSPVTSGATNAFTPASHHVNETGVGGYAAAYSGDCDASGNVTLVAGQTKNCTITNTALPAIITLTKAVSSGSASAIDFTMRVDGNAVPSGSSVQLTANTAHTITEDSKAGYNFVSLTGTGCPSTLGGTATLNEGQSISCTITNAAN